MDCFKQILRGPDNLWIDGLAFDFPSQQVTSRAFFRQRVASLLQLLDVLDFIRVN